MLLLFDQVETPIGTMVLIAGDRVLLLLEFADSVERYQKELKRRFGDYELNPTADPFGFSSLLKRYFAGDIRAVDQIATDGGGTAFQRLVWAELRRIPSGTTISYHELARRIGSPNAMRAVGAANGRNPVSVVVPCHRVIGADGSMTGYSGGEGRKEWLLKHEGALLV
jgi:methylated-DNA-[protein]-cysteine S-methyltransferase